VLLPALAAWASAADSPALLGLWIHHEDWNFAPAEIQEDNPGAKWANAAMVNFCPDGVFRLATGVVNQSDGNRSTGLGASDGLAIYHGRWRIQHDVIMVEYQLTSAEFRELTQDPVASGKNTGEFRRDGRQLEFLFTTADGRRWPLKFTAAQNYEKELENWFVECDR
jgi:hypothetical protein